MPLPPPPLPPNQGGGAPGRQGAPSHAHGKEGGVRGQQHNGADPRLVHDEYYDDDDMDMDMGSPEIGDENLIESFSPPMAPKGLYLR